MLDVLSLPMLSHPLPVGSEIHLRRASTIRPSTARMLLRRIVCQPCHEHLNIQRAQCNSCIDRMLHYEFRAATHGSCVIVVFWRPHHCIGAARPGANLVLTLQLFFLIGSLKNRGDTIAAVDDDTFCDNYLMRSPLIGQYSPVASYARRHAFSL